MSSLTLVPCCLAVTIVMFAMNRPRLNAVALMMLTVGWKAIVLIVSNCAFRSFHDKQQASITRRTGFVSPNCSAGHCIRFAALFAVSGIPGLIVSNATTAVLLPPVALIKENNSQLSAYSFAMFEPLDASTAFMTPVSSLVDPQAVESGNCTFGDVVRIVVPYAIAALITSVIIVFTLLPP